MVYFVSLNLVQADDAEALLGLWTWYCLLARPTLSVWSVTYTFVRQLRGHGAHVHNLLLAAAERILLVRAEAHEAEPAEPAP